MRMRLVWEFIRSIVSFQDNDDDDDDKIKWPL